MADEKDKFGRQVVRDSRGNVTGVRVGDVKPIEVESDEDRNDRNELANANEWDRPSIAKRQAARRAAKAAAKAAATTSPTTVESPVVLKPKQ